MPCVQGIESDDLATLLEVLNLVHFQLNLILHAHIWLDLGNLSLLVNRVCSFTFKHLPQTLLLKIFLCLFLFKVSERNTKLRNRDSWYLLDKHLRLSGFLGAVERRINRQFSCRVHKGILLFEIGWSSCNWGCSGRINLPSKILRSLCHHAQSICRAS